MINNAMPQINSGEIINNNHYLELEILRWKTSPKRMMMIDGERYYNGDHDILHRKRTVIGKNGELEEINNVPNNRIVDNQFKKMVDQKANFLFSKPVTFESKNETFSDALNDIFNHQFLTKLKILGVNSYLGGISWLYVYYDKYGEIQFKVFKPYEVLPFWQDSEHTILDYAVRLYEVEVYNGSRLTIEEKVEVYKEDGIYRYDLVNNHLKEDADEPYSPYMKVDGQGYNWERLPLIPFKSNFQELPLIRSVKSLQDTLNLLISNYVNNLDEDPRNTILILKNYEGENLGEFRRNLSQYGAVKVRTIDGADGGVEALRIEVNAQNYELILKTIKKSIIENARGYDAKDDRIGSHANQMNLMSMYNDISLDADNTENEYQASFEKLLFFVKAYLATKGIGEFDNEKVKIIFNRDMLLNTSEIIDDLVKLGIRLPNSVLVPQVPFINDPDLVLKDLEKEDREQQMYAQAFQQPQVNDNEKSRVLD